MNLIAATRAEGWLVTTCPGGWVGRLDEIKAILSPAGAWLFAELGNIDNEIGI